MTSFVSEHTTNIGKHRVLSREVTCNYRLYFKIGHRSVKQH